MYDLDVGYIYYIKWGTTKYVPRWDAEVGHIYFIKWGTTKYVPQWGTKWGTKVGHMAQSGAHLLYKVGHNKICAPVGHKVGHKSGAQQNMCPIGAQCGAQKLGTFVLRFGFKVE